MREVLICPVCGAKTFRPFLICKDYTVSQETFQLIECVQCYFVATNVSPHNTTLSTYYVSDSYISHSNEALTLVDKFYLLARTFTVKWKVNLINRYLHDATAVTLLDYGCGTGEFLKACTARDWKIYGIEPSGKARQKSLYTTQTLIASSLKDISINHFNVITLWHVLEHIPDLNETIEKLKEKLNDSGTMFIAVPNHRSSDAKYYDSYWAGYDVPRHLWHFSQSTMQKLLQKNGLKLIRTVPMKLDAFYVSLLSEKYKNNGNLNVAGFIMAILNGIRSNFHARSKNEYSSLIYIVRK